MGSRRRAGPTVLSDAAHPTLRLMCDVSVERVDAGRVIALSDAPLPHQEPLVLELPGELGVRARVDVRVESSQPVEADGLRRWRLVLRTIPQGHARTGGHVHHIEPPARLPALGVLIRRVTVQVGDVTAGGCLLEGLEPVPDAGIAQLEIPSDGGRRVETVRLCGMTRGTGRPGHWRAQAEFLAFDAPVSRSARNMMARFEIMDELERGEGDPDADAHGAPRGLVETHA